MFIEPMHECLRFSAERNTQPEFLHSYSFHGAYWRPLLSTTIVMHKQTNTSRTVRAVQKRQSRSAWCCSRAAACWSHRAQWLPEQFAAALGAAAAGPVDEGGVGVEKSVAVD